MVIGTTNSSLFLGEERPDPRNPIFGESKNVTGTIRLANMNHEEPTFEMPFEDKDIESSIRAVIKDWTATYPDPIQVTAGEPMELDGRADVWDGYRWLWAKNLDGKEGWVPDCIISANSPAIATEDYTAMELTCQKGQTLKAERTLHGWVFCSNDDGKKGWVPERNLARAR